MSGKPSKPAGNRKRADRAELPLTFLPQSNRQARIAYICALIGLIPAVGLLIGPVAAVFGWLGFRKAGQLPNKDGIGHSFVSIVLGLLEFAAAGVGLWLLGRSDDWW